MYNNSVLRLFVITWRLTKEVLCIS